MTDFSTLQESLLKAKRVMNMEDDTTPTNPNRTRSQPVDSAELLTSLPPRNMPPINPSMGGGSELQEAQRVGNLEAMSKKPGVDRIQSSKLPDAIKQLMVEHPIPEVNFQNSLPDSLIEGVSEKMKKLGGLPDSSVNNNISKKTKPTYTNSTNNNSKIKSSDLKNIIRKTIIETIDELIDEKINDRLSESKKLNESLQLVVGNTVFKGNIISTKKLS